jgi:hypothetical protein
MEPTQAQAATDTPAAPPSGADTSTSQPDLKDASLEQLDELMTTGKVTLAPKPGGGEQEAPKGEALKVETPPASGEQPTPPVETPTETPPVETPVETETPTETPVETETPVVETPTPPEAPKGEEETASRFRFTEPKDRAIAALKKARPDLSWSQVEAMVATDEPAAPTTEAVIEQAPVVVAALGNIETIKAEITTRETLIDEYGKEERLPDAEYTKATRELSRLQGDLVRAENAHEKAIDTAKTELQSRETEAARHRDAKMASKKTAIELYPDVADGNTALSVAVAKAFEEMKDPNHPDNPILYADSAPEIVTERVAKKLGIQPKAKAKAVAPPVTPATPVQVQPPRRTVSPPSGGKTSVPVVPPAEDAQKTLEHLQSPEATLEELDAAFNASDPAAVLAAAVR